MTLSEYLQRARLERAEQRGARVDDCVISPDGVLDLRADTAKPTPKMPHLPEVGKSDIEDLYNTETTTKSRRLRRD